MASDLKTMSLAKLAEDMGQAGGPGGRFLAELMRRQTEAQINAARYMGWSVVAIAITSGLNALFVFLSWFFPYVQ